MASVTDPQGGGFRPAMLLNDKRYRGLTFQFIALVLIIVLMAFLGINLVRNLAAAGLDISYSFLGDPANYDINQSLIEYSSRSTHMRAAVVGLLNTLLVSIMACVTATVIGVIAGVLRLSKNWLVRKLMSAYVEAFRNVPVLIWILMIGTVVQQLPAPSAFRGDDPDSTMWFGMIAATNRGIYVPAPVWGPGSLVVIAVFLISIVGVVLYRRHAVSRLYSDGTLLPTFWPSLGILVLPTLIAYFAMGQPVSLDIPELQGFNFGGGLQVQRPLIALWLALSVYTGAFIAENVRAGILSVSHGQSEAAASLGLRPRRVMSLVVLPQALRVIVPPLISQYLNITKNSSLAIAVGYADITATLGGITLNQTGRAIETILLLMLFYLIVSLSISAVMNLYNASVALKER
ncbi:ABC transporter permease subunit [Palleronia sp. LCG004]|uniref:amino acid ABC transporter permease n=1 Tax=Palleronia sp. LCG004 TaxID=3079304 RepID=UPI002943BB42|nr:ABC transporter permease subunit [Palleronia sp. LCG004]WOI56537.1 ABC transporter permease subunit [Palleronia sp. LCG004]